VCGVGGCAVNQHGRVVCSSTPGGGCAVNQHGRVVCN
jgi:isoaspartyl peptidase/L-asparaginase-like protein (Ntn-hydrolase superfamily)